MRAIDADVLKQHIDKLPALPDGNFAGNHSALKALINMQPTIESSTNCSEFPNNSDTISRQAAIDAIEKHIDTFDAIDTNYLDGLRTAMNLLHELPSAQPQNENLKFLEFLWNTINPNEMEQYLEMYSSKEVKSNG